MFDTGTPSGGAPGTGAAALLPLVVRDVTLRLGGATILDGLSFDLAPGGCTVVMGPNGAGKSLLLKLLHGLLKPTAGRIDWGGLGPEEATARQALVFQKPVLLRRSVASNLDFVLRARRKDRGRRAALLRHVGLADKAAQPARLLSGGEAQRLALARALATDPEVLLLDEPTASLDPASVLAIERIVAQARDGDTVAQARDGHAAAQRHPEGMRIILVTHDIGQARRMADDVLFLHRGRIAEHADAAAFFSRPRSQAARDYLGGRIVL